MKLPATVVLITVVLVIGLLQTPRAKQRNPAAVVLARQEHKPAAISLDQANVYWIAESRSAIHRVSKTGGTITPVVTGQEGINRMIVDGDFIYFHNATQIKRVRKTGGDATTLITFADLGTTQIIYWRLSVDQKNIYFVAGPKGDQLMKLSKTGGEPRPLAEVLLPTNFVSDGVNIYWADYLFGVKKVNVEGGEPVTIGECENAGAVAVDLTSVFCATDKGKVVRFSKTNGAMTTLASVDNASFDQLAVDERSVYALSLLTGIYRLAKKGGQPVRLVPLDQEVVNFDIDALNIFWSNYSEGTIMRRRK